MPGKFKVVISDLHLGAGYQRQGNLLEDFDRDQDFAAFLAEIVSVSTHEHCAVELILNGDTFEMLQVPPVARFAPDEVYPPQTYRSFSEASSLAKMNHIVAGHRTFFDALGRYISAGAPRRTVTFVKGNHDLDLYWPAVKKRIRQAVTGHAADDPLLTFEECCVHREGIHVEHGNQYEGPISRVGDMTAPLRKTDPPQIEIPPGSQFVIDVLNQVERDKYWIDGIKPIPALVWYTLAYDFPFAFTALVKLLLSAPALVAEVMLSPGSLAGEILRARNNPRHVERLAIRYRTDTAFRSQFNVKVADALHPLVEEQPLAYSAVHDRSDAPLFARQAQRAAHRALREAAERIGAQTDSSVVVFGHIHEATEERSATSAVSYFNSGTWTWHADFGTAGKETWRELFEHPERFTNDRKLSYVRIDYADNGQPTGRLLEYHPARYSSVHARLKSWFHSAH